MNIRQLGLRPYAETLLEMQAFVEQSTTETNDEIWFVEHHPVYTQGTACDLQSLLASDIPVIKSDRGGQITYHGPGQIVMYVMFNLKRHSLGVKAFVTMLEQTMINVLEGYQIFAERQQNAPGVYVDGAKIGALGLRFRKGFSYHGLSLNVNMDLAPFQNIDPCGYKGMPVTQMIDQFKIHNQPDKQSIFSDVQNALQKELLSLLSES